MNTATQELFPFANNINGVMRKIPSTLDFRSTKTFNQNYFSNLQFAFQSNVTERIIHPYKAITSLKPTWDRFAIDGNNAFNSCNRNRALFEIKKNFQDLFQLLSAMYGNSSSVWYYGLYDDHIYSRNCFYLKKVFNKVTFFRLGFKL